MKQIHNITERVGEFVADRRNRIGIAELTAHGATLTALVLTFALSFATVELNPVAAWLFDTIGYPATGALAMIVVGLLFDGYRRLEPHFGRTAEAGAWAIASVGVLDVTVNLWRLSTVGFPETTLMRTVWAICLAGTLGIASVLLVRKHGKIIAGARRVSFPSVAVRPTFVASLALLIALSTITVALPLGGPIGQNLSPVGDATAQVQGHELVYASDNSGSITAIDPEGGQTVWKVTPHSDRVWDVTLGSQGEVLYTASADGTAKALDTTDGSVIWTADPSASDLDDGSLSPDGSQYVVGGSSGWIAGIETSDGAIKWNHQRSSGNVIDSLDVGPDGRVFYGADSEIGALTADGEFLWKDSTTFASGGVGITAIDASGINLLVSGENNKVVIMAKDGQNTIEEFSRWNNNVKDIEWAQDGNAIFVATEDGGTVDRISLDGEGTNWSESHWSNAPQGLNLGPKGDTLYVATDNPGVWAIEARDGSEIWGNTDPGENVKDVAGPIPEPEPPEPETDSTQFSTVDYDLSVCYQGNAEFQSVGATANWNPYPTSADNSWASSEYTGDSSTTEFTRYGESTLEDANASPNVSYRVGVQGERAAFVFDGVNPTEGNTRGQFEIASPFEDWVTDPARISSSGECGPAGTATPSGTTTPMPTPVGTPPGDADPTALGTCTLPGSEGAKTGLLVEYWDPSMSTESIWFNLSYAGTSINEFVEFDSPKGYYYGCHGASGGITPPDGDPPTAFPSPTEFPNGSQPTAFPSPTPYEEPTPYASPTPFPNGSQPTPYPEPEPPTLNGSANTTDGGSINFSEYGFEDTDPSNSLNGSLGGGFGPTGGGGGGGSPVVGIALVSAVGYGALRLTGNDKRVAEAARKAVGRLR